MSAGRQRRAGTGRHAETAGRRKVAWEPGVPRTARRAWTAVLVVISVIAAPGQVACGETPAPLLEGTPKPRPTSLPPRETVAQAVERGVEFLLQDQNSNGSWGSATRTKELNIFAPVPGAHHAFRAAVTSLAISALIQSRSPRPEVAQAITHGEQWLKEHLPRVRRATGDALYNVWAHAYAIEALVDLMDFGTSSLERDAQLRELITGQVELLERYESVDGGWGYYDFRAETRQPSSNPTSFTTATGVIALKRAESVGVRVPEELLQRAVRCIQRQRNPDFTYHYSFNGLTNAQPVRSINRPGGSLGRSQVCNLALRWCGDPLVTDQVINVWLDRLFARNLWLDMGRKRPIPHESHFLVAGYFYYYGHWYAARLLDWLPPEDQPRHKAQLARLMVDLQERDGSWWDFPLYAYHQPYGTSMAIMTLMRCLD